MKQPVHHREEQARMEVGNTAVHPAVARLLVAFFVLCIAGPLIGHLFSRNTDGDDGRFQRLEAALDIPPGPEEISRSIRTRGALNGLVELNRSTQQRIENFETRLQQSSALRGALVGPANRLLTGRLGAGNADVYPGTGSWLFYGPAVRHVTGPPFLPARESAPHGRERDPMAALKGFHAALAARGIELVVVPVPGKASVYPERFNPRYRHDTPPRNAAWNAFATKLEDAGIILFDPADTLLAVKKDSPAYLARDSHWTPAAMAHCAEALAARLESMGVLPARIGEPFTRSAAQSVSNTGDLATMVYPGGTTETEPETVQIHPIHVRDGRPWRPSAAGSVLLLGDSFTNIYSQSALGWGEGAGFAEQLSYYLQRPVNRIAQNDNGAFAAREALGESLAAGTDILAHTRVVVYQFAARELSWGNWKTNLTLDGGGGPAKPSALPDTVTVTARILDQTMPPTPNSVPYKDCITTLLLSPEPARDGLPERLLVRAWGMRDHRWTGVTDWQVGDRVDVTLRRWAAVSEALESINRVPLDDDTAMTLEAWWLAPAPEMDPADEPPPPSAGPDLAARIDALAPDEQPVYQGEDGWLFFLPELRSLAAGPFWGAAAPEVSRARNPQFADPRPAILDFHRQLEGAGIELLLVPVPPKAGIYPGALGDPDLAGSVREAMAPHGALPTFLTALREAGVSVVDLAAAYREEAGSGPPLYCKTDTHWSPRGIEIAAGRIAGAVRDRPWYAAAPKTDYAEESVTINIHGDLAAMLPDTPFEETVSLTRVGHAMPDGLQPIEPDRSSPVLLIGDSHNLAFHAGGDMHATAGGLPDRLAGALGFPVDLVAVRGSGATAPRITLARRGDQLAGKKVVIWCFSAREFTESGTGWRVVPIHP